MKERLCIPATIDLKRIGFLFFQFLFACSFIFIDTRSIYMNITTTPGILYIFRYFAPIVFLAGMFLFSPKIKIKKFERTITVVGLLMCYLMVYFLLQSNHRGSLLKITIPFVAVLVYYFLWGKYDDTSALLITIKNIIVIIAIGSLLLWFFGPILHILKPSGYVFSTWTPTGKPEKTAHYLYLYFETQKATMGTILNEPFTRNTAIFVEAPMASFYFTVGLLIEYITDKNLFKMGVLILAIFSTLSVTGYCIVAIFIFLHYIQSDSNSGISKLIKFVFFPIAIIIIISFLIFFLSAKMGTRSANTRTDDFVVCFKTWLQSPILGVGVGNNDAIFANMDGWRIREKGLSNSPSQILAHGGLYISALYMGAILSGYYHIIKSKNKRMFIFLTIFLINFTFAITSYLYLTLYIFIFVADNQFNQKGRSLIWLSKNP